MTNWHDKTVGDQCDRTRDDLLWEVAQIRRGIAQLATNLHPNAMRADRLFSAVCQHLLRQTLQ